MRVAPADSAAAVRWRPSVTVRRVLPPAVLTCTDMGGRRWERATLAPWAVLPRALALPVAIALAWAREAPRNAALAASKRHTAPTNSRRAANRHNG